MGPRFCCSVSEPYFSVYGQGHCYLRDVCIPKVCAQTQRLLSIAPQDTWLC